MDRPIELTTEQQFNLRAFEVQASKMSLEQSHQFMVDLYRQMLLRETLYKRIFQEQWGISTPTLDGIKGDD